MTETFLTDETVYLLSKTKITFMGDKSVMKY